MTRLHRITQNPDVMGGRPCIRGLRVTVGIIVRLLATGHEADEVLTVYPYLERDDIRQALAYAASRSEEQEVRVELKFQSPLGGGMHSRRGDCNAVAMYVKLSH